MNNPLILFVGKSGSGKTTIADYFECTKGYKQVHSYTTRKPRHKGEIGHVFVTEEEFDALGELVAYTEYNGYRYGVTAPIVDEANIYVVDIPGVKTLLNNYKTERPIFIFYFKSTVATRIDRMLQRGDCDTAILSRLQIDEQYDWLEELRKVSRDFGKRKTVILQVIDANKSQKDVIEDILWYLGWED